MQHVAHTSGPTYASARLARGRGLMRVGRLLALIVAIGVVLVLVGLGYEALAEANDARQYPPPGKLVTVDGHALHLHCSGPATAMGATVILEAGPGSNGLTWSLVQPAVARFARVCSYDRAGLGWSAPGPAPRSGAQIVSELHRLLANAGVPPPYVLVGHSDGGAYSRLFTMRYPETVAGLVLVDARNADAGNLPALGPPPARSLPMLARLGLVRLLDGAVAGPQSTALDRLPAGVQAMAHALATRPAAFETAQREAAALAETDATLRQAFPLGELPLAVVTHGRPDPAYALPGEEQWQNAQARLAALSPRGVQIIASHSGHNIQLDQPDLVIDAIQQIVGAVQR